MRNFGVEKKSHKIKSKFMNAFIDTTVSLSARTNRKVGSKVVK